MDGVVVGKYAAIVSKNSFNDPECPFKGCIKVLCPDLLGWEPQPKGGLPFEAVKSKMVESDWVRPHWTHPSDAYVPEVGEGVYVECLGGHGLEAMIWTGIYPGEDFDNLYDPNPVTNKRAGVSPKLSEVTDRIIGTRNGTYIKIEDKDNGKLILEVFGTNPADVTNRKGCQVEIDPSLDQIKVIAQDDVGATKVTTTMKKDSYEVSDTSNNKFKMDTAGITVEDKSGNKQEMTSSGIKWTDCNGNTIEMAGTSVKINGTALEVTQ